MIVLPAPTFTLTIPLRSCLKNDPAVVNKKLVHHHTKDVFGYQTWTLPLIHTKNNGSTVVSGVYKKDFEVLLIHPCDRVRHSFDSARSSSSSAASSTHESQSTSTASSAASFASSSASTLLPSSSYSPHSKIKYTIRAVLQRPFPSLSNVEASQEVWVVNDSPPCESGEPHNLYEVSSEGLESSPSTVSSSCASSVHSQESVSDYEGKSANLHPSTPSVPHPLEATPRKHTSLMPYVGQQVNIHLPLSLFHSARLSPLFDRNLILFFSLSLYYKQLLA